MINKLPIKKLVEFRRLSDKRQSNFAQRLKFPKESNPDGGGDYWIPSISGLSNAYKSNSNLIVKEKLEELLNKLEVTKHNNTRKMYQRNIDILYNYEDFDFSTWRPISNLEFVKHKSSEPIVIKNIPIQTTPSHVFSFGKKEKPSIGAIKFVTWQEGFHPIDLGIFSDATYRYLSEHYSKKYIVDPDFCLTIDAPQVRLVTYKQVLNGEISSSLDVLIDKLNKYLL